MNDLVRNGCNSSGFPMQNQDVELRNIVAILRRQIRVIGLCFLCVFAFAAVFLVTATPKYTATALVLVDPDKKNLIDPALTRASSPSSDNARVDSEVEILKSSAVGLGVIAGENLIADPEFGPWIGVREKLTRAVGFANAAPATKPQLLAETLAKFKHAVTIRRKGLTYLISVSVSSQSPTRAADLANAVSRTYIQQQVQSKIMAAEAARDILQNQIASARRSMANSEGLFDDFVTRNISRLDPQSGQSSLDAKNAKLAGWEKDLGVMRQTKSDVQGFLETQSWEKLVDALGDQALLQLEQERQELVSKLAGTDGDESREIDLVSQLKDLEAKFDEPTLKAVNRMAFEIQKIESSASQIRTEIRAQIQKAELPPDLLTEIFAVQQEASIARVQYQTLVSRLRDIETQSRTQIANSHLVSPALAPISASFPNKNLVLLTAFAVATGLGMGLAFLNEYYIGGVTSEFQLSELLQAPQITTIPHVVDHNEGRLSIADHIADAPLSQYSESLRNLRANLDLALFANDIVSQISSGRVILVSSALAKEGKTTTSLALARTYALAGKKTLLIDADLRTPTVHIQLGIEPQAGFLEFLKNPEKTETNDAFYARDVVSPLVVLLGAERSENPTDQLLNSSTFAALLKQAKEVFDIVIIDSPPLLPVVDGRYIARHVDAVVLMVRAGVTSQADLRTAVQPLRMAMRTDAALFPVLGQKETRKGSLRYA